MALFSRFVFALALSLFVTGAAFAQNKEKPRCLDYTSVGMADCHVVPAPVSPTEPEPEIEEPVAAPAPTLDDKIDDFMEDYGKPPREFVAFSLEPTLDNALVWAQKYREMIDRNQRLTRAWQQAQEILAAREGTDGADIPPLPDALPPVPDFSPMAMQAQKQQQKASPKAPRREAGQSGITMGAIEARSGSLTEADTPSDMPININYYFSAECPYCKKFEKEFQGVINKMSEKLSVTCVDMTPSDKVSSNILGKVDCSWRPIQLGEAQRFGVQSTPTLIIDRQQGKALERVSGYVDGKSLLDYLMGTR